MSQEPWEKFLRQSNRRKRGVVDSEMGNEDNSGRIKQEKIPIKSTPDAREYLLTHIPNLSVSSLDRFHDFPPEIQDDIAEDIQKKIKAGMKIENIPEHFELLVDKAYQLLAMDSDKESDIKYKPKLSIEELKLKGEKAEWVDEFVGRDIKKMEKIELRPGDKKKLPPKVN